MGQVARFDKLRNLEGFRVMLERMALDRARELAAAEMHLMMESGWDRLLDIAQLAHAEAKERS
jgi:hypothetical protein